MIVSEDLLRAMLRRAYLRGFADSREGWNGECPQDHLAPHPRPNEQNRDYRASGFDFEAIPAFVQLRDAAVETLFQTVVEASRTRDPWGDWMVGSDHAGWACFYEEAPARAYAATLKWPAEVKRRGT